MRCCCWLAVLPGCAAVWLLFRGRRERALALAKQQGRFCRCFGPWPPVGVWHLPGWGGSGTWLGGDRAPGWRDLARGRVSGVPGWHRYMYNCNCTPPSKRNPAFHLAASPRLSSPCARPLFLVSRSALPPQSSPALPSLSCRYRTPAVRIRPRHEIGRRRVKSRGAPEARVLVCGLGVSVHTVMHSHQPQVRWSQSSHSPGQ